MTGTCACGCGERTEIAAKTSQRDGLIAGQPKRYLHGHNARRGVPGGPRGGRRPSADLADPVGYAEALAARSALVVGAVHDEGPDAVLAAIRHALALDQPPGMDPVVALVTVLAAQIDPDTTASDRLAWCTPTTGPRSPGSRSRGVA